MNLVTDGWIPVLYGNGQSQVVSLREAFERGEEIRDLTMRPHERIAMMRLLICIAQSSLEGPRDSVDWNKCRPDIATAAVRYLDRWREGFELFGDGQRFLQLPNLKPRATAGEEAAETPASKLDLALATENNATLFDNAGGSDRSFSPKQMALMLLTFQCFSPGGRIGLAQWDGKPTPGNGSSDHAPCLSGKMLHTLLRESSLIGTLYRNLLHKVQAEELFGPDCWGRAVWECMPKSEADAAAVENATHSYLGRLTPLARAVWLQNDGQSVVLANGLAFPTYDDGWREPAATVVIRHDGKGQPKRHLLAASVHKAVWRELHSLTVKSAGQGPGGPAALKNLPNDLRAFDIWVGGLISNQAKLIDVTESVFHIPAAMLDDLGQRVYEAGIKCAEERALSLSRAVSVYHRELGDSLDRPQMRDRRLQIHLNAYTHFWTDVEQAVPVLMQLAAEPGPLGDRGDWRSTSWGRSAKRAAAIAFSRICPQETARQIRAHALGLNELHSSSTRRLQPNRRSNHEPT